METKLTLKEKNLITLGLQQVKLIMETSYPDKNTKSFLLRALVKTELANDVVARTYAKNEIEKMFA